MFQQVGVQYQQSSYYSHSSYQKGGAAASGQSEVVDTRQNTNDPEKADQVKDTTVSSDQKVFDVDEVVGNILDFVRGRIAVLPEEEQEAALKQAAAGAEAGITEARDILQNMGALTDDLNAGIDTALQQLAEKFQSPDALFEQTDVEDVNAEALVTDSVVNQLGGSGQAENESVETSPVVQPLPEIPQAPQPNQNDQSAGLGRRQLSDFGFSGVSQQSSYYERQQDLSLQVKTNDGDLVTLKLNQNQSVGQSSLNSGGFSANAFEAGESGEFFFEVEGELDQGELEALNELFGDVSALADEFYNGDMEQAFDMAMSLDIDFSELSSMSLNMKDQTSYAAQAYSNMSDSPSLPKAFEPLQNYVQSYADLVSKAQESFDNRLNLNELLEIQPQTDNKFSQIHDELFNKLFGS